MVALPDWVESCCETALTITDPVEGTVAGAVSVAVVAVTLLKVPAVVVKVTALLNGPVPVTVIVMFTVAPVATEVAEGTTETPVMVEVDWVTVSVVHP